jgi:hypothetical protein
LEHRHDDDDDGDDGDVLAHWRRSNASEFAITLSHKKYLIQAGKRNRRYIAGVPPREAVCNQEEVQNQTPGIMDKARKSKLEEVSTKTQKPNSRNYGQVPQDRRTGWLLVQT